MGFSGRGEWGRHKRTQAIRQYKKLTRITSVRLKHRMAKVLILLVLLLMHAGVFAEPVVKRGWFGLTCDKHCWRHKRIYRDAMAREAGMMHKRCSYHRTLLGTCYCYGPPRCN